MGSGSAGTSSQAVFERVCSHAHKPSRAVPRGTVGGGCESWQGQLDVGSGRQTHQLTLKVRQPMLEMTSLRR